MKPINTSIFDFPTLIQNGCVYVDKTAQIYEIARPDADGIYFVPRPRRFGKSKKELALPNAGKYVLSRRRHSIRRMRWRPRRRHSCIKAGISRSTSALTMMRFS